MLSGEAETGDSLGILNRFGEICALRKSGEPLFLCVAILGLGFPAVSRLPKIIFLSCVVDIDIRSTLSKKPARC